MRAIERTLNEVKREKVTVKVTVEILHKKDQNDYNNCSNFVREQLKRHFSNTSPRVLKTCRKQYSSSRPGILL